MKKCGKISAKVLYHDDYLQRMKYEDLYQTIGDLV